MTKSFPLLFLFQLVLLVSFSHAAETGKSHLDEPKKSTRKVVPGKIQYGTASFYADKFEGKKTANGEIFTQKGLTAAHNSLPLGTWIKVTNLSNHKVVIVKVNDRLHRNNPRLVDLSKKAAKTLGYTGQGLTKVRVDVLGKNPEMIAKN